MRTYVLALVALLMLGGKAQAESCTPPPYPAIHYDVITLSEAEFGAEARAYYAWEGAWHSFRQCMTSQDDWGRLVEPFMMAFREWMGRRSDWRSGARGASGISGCVDPIGAPPQIPDGAADDQAVDRVAQDVEDWLVRMNHATSCKYPRRLPRPERVQAVHQLLAAYDRFLDAYHRDHPLRGTTITDAAHIAPLPRTVHPLAPALLPPPVLDANTCPMEHFQPDLSRRGRSPQQLQDDAKHYYRAHDAFYACYNRLLALHNTTDRDWQDHVKAYYEAYIKELDTAVPSWGYADSATSDDVAAPPHDASQDETAASDAAGNDGADNSGPANDGADDGQNAAPSDGTGHEGDDGVQDVNGGDDQSPSTDDTANAGTDEQNGPGVDNDNAAPANESGDQNGADQSGDDQNQ